MTGHSNLAGEIDAIAAEKGFSGVVQIDHRGEVELTAAYGLANRGYRVSNPHSDVPEESKRYGRLARRVIFRAWRSDVGSEHRREKLTPQ